MVGGDRCEGAAEKGRVGVFGNRSGRFFGRTFGQGGATGKDRNGQEKQVVGLDEVGTPRCGVTGRVQRAELVQTTMIKGSRCAAERGADSAARPP